MQSISLYRFRLFLLFTIFFCGAGKLYAQPAIYPVQLHVQLLPPFTPCLFDYVNDDYTRLRVVALQRDMRETEYQFSLQFTVKQGNTIKMQTKPFKINYENNFKVRPGVATTVSGRQLSNIFQSINDKQSLCLPEGYYELIFQAIDTKTNMPISEPSATFVYFQKGQPPFPISPADGSCIKDEGTTMIKFSWVDQTASMGLNKYYNLEVFEVRDDFAYQNIAQSQKADFSPTEKIMIPFYGMPVTAANFQKGKRYAWRVQVLNTQNDNKAAFKNNGYSEMFFFDYGTCINPFDALLSQSTEEKKVKTLTKDKPELLRIDTTHISASAVWKNEEKYHYFLVEYRRKDALMKRDWVVQSSLNTGEAAVADGAPDSLLLNGITREVVYEVRVQGCFKDGKFSQYSDILEFKLAREAVPECGNELPALSSTDKKNTPLEKDDIINANGYKVTITEITKNSDGTFSGYGKVDAPILKLLPLRVKFDNITLNKENELMNGRIVTVHNPATSATFDLNGVLNKESRGKLLNEQGATIPKVDVNNLTTENYNSVVQDAEGNVYVVDSEGNKTKVGTINNNIAIEKGTRSANLGEVKFSVDQNMPFDEDAGAFKDKGFIEEHYQTLKENYQVPWTLVPTGQMREIKAKISKALSGYQPSDVKFVCTDNVILESKYNESDKTYTIPVFGGDERTSQGVYAVVPEQPNNPNNRNHMTLGKILLAHYTEKTLDVVIVPVNRTDVETRHATSLQDELNKIYNPIGVKVNVEVQEEFKVSTTDLDLSKGLNVDDTKKWERETEEMRTLQRLYAQSGRTLKSGTVYLFALEKANVKGVQGDMPRDKRNGYIFGDEINNARLIAHELGHGAFTLEHTFNYGVAEKSTDNLMDYSTGSFLTCWQWYIAHNQRFVWSFMENDEDAMKRIKTREEEHKEVLRILKIIELAYHNSDPFYLEDLVGKIIHEQDAYTLVSDVPIKGKIVRLAIVIIPQKPFLGKPIWYYQTRRTGHHGINTEVNKGQTMNLVRNKEEYWNRIIFYINSGGKYEGSNPTPVFIFFNEKDEDVIKGFNWNINIDN